MNDSAFYIRSLGSSSAADRWGLIDVAQMRAIDSASAAAGVSVTALMEEAGRAVAEDILARWTPRRTAVLCGPGANGGDGWVAARHLQNAGWPVWVETVCAREALRKEAAAAAAQFDGRVLSLGAETESADLVVDALFGAGLSRPLDGEAARLAGALMPARVVAIDVPSGVDGDSGRPLEGRSFRAALTVTFVRKKPAHVLMPGRELCGEVLVADIDVPDAVLNAQRYAMYENAPALWTLPWPSADAHKHTRGHVFVASGGHTRTGAARLAARAALRSGAGLVTLLSPPEALAENAAQLTAIMLREATGASAYAAAAQSCQAMVIGPALGLGDDHRQALHAALEAANRAALVLDADALTLLGPIEKPLGLRDVLTPHMGEFRRLFPDLLQHSHSKIEAVRRAAVRADAIVLLKGPDTVIAAPDGRTVVNTVGTPFLATAGAGDVLAGIIAGLIAQGMPSFDAAAAASWLHGATAARFGPGLIAEDVSELLPQTLRRLAPAHLHPRELS